MRWKAPTEGLWQESVILFVIVVVIVIVGVVLIIVDVIDFWIWSYVFFDFWFLWFSIMLLGLIPRACWKVRVLSDAAVGMMSDRDGFGLRVVVVVTSALCISALCVVICRSSARLF